MKYLTYPEFLQKFGKLRCKTCNGCLDSLKDYKQTSAPLDNKNYREMKIPSWLLESYEEELSGVIVGERSDRIQIIPI